MNEDVNPTYNKAVGYVRDWVDNQRDLGELLIRIKRDAFEAFKEKTDKQYNESESGLLELFEAVLSIIPGASVLRETLKLFQKGSKLYQATGAIKELADKADDTKKVIEAGKAVGTVAGASGGGSGDAKLDFQLTVLRELSDLDISLVNNLVRLRILLISRLELFEHVRAGIDLVAEVKKILGELPPPPPPDEAWKQARDRFEQELYKRFYFDSGRYSRWIHQEYRLGNPFADRKGKWVTFAVEHRDIPEKAVNYIEEKNLWAFMAKDEPAKVVFLKGVQVTEMRIPGLVLGMLPVHAPR